MPNDDNKIILEFPATNVEIELGETITFDNISGFLDSERVTYNGDSLTEIITHLENDKADKTYVDTELAKKADKTDTYTKSQVDTALNGKADKDTTYTKTQVDSEISRLDGRIDTKANASDVYTKSQTDNLLNDKANASDVYTKQTTDALLNDKADVTDLPDMTQYYDKSEVDDLLDDKANSDDVYDKTYIDTALSGKANVGTSYTKSEEDALLANKADKSDTYTKEQVDDIVYGILPDDTASGSVANFTTSLELPIKSLEVDVNAVQESGTPTPASPLPISSRSSISVVHCRKNFLDNTNIKSVSGWQDLGGDSYQILLNLRPNATYTISGKHTVPSGLSPYVYLQKYVNDAWTNVSAFWQNQNNNLPYTFTTDDSPYRLWAYNAVASINTIDWLQIEAGTSASDYEQYSEPITEVINLGGTYYGGHFTQDKDGHRQFVVTSESKKINEFEGWYFISSYSYFECNVENLKKCDVSTVLEGLLCECYATRTASQAGSGNVDGSIAGYFDTSTDKTRLRVKDNNYRNAAEWLNTMGENRIVYPLAEPFIIDLPDGEPIVTLNGTNNIYADTGNCAVEYKCSVAEYVANHSGGGGAKSLGGVFLGGSNSGSEEEPTKESEEPTEEPKEVTKTLGDEPISKK